MASAGNLRSATARFSLRWPTEDVPGISRMFGDLCSSQASATCIGVAFRRAATSDSAVDCSGVKPPSGKKRHIGDAGGGFEVFDQGVIVAVRQVMHWFCTQTMSVMPCGPSATLFGRDIAEADMTHQSPRSFRPFRTRSGASIEPSLGP